MIPLRKDPEAVQRIVDYLKREAEAYNEPSEIIGGFRTMNSLLRIAKEIEERSTLPGEM